MSETSLILTIEPDLKARFLAEADAVHRPAEELLREMVETFVARQQEAREHDAWFRGAIEEALREVDDPTTRLIPDEEVWASWDARRAELLKGANAV